MTPSEIVTKFCTTVTNDIDAGCALLADDVEYDNVPMGKVFGPDAAREFLNGMLMPGMDVEFIVHRQTASGQSVINERTDRFTVEGTPYDLPVCGVFEVNDEGKISLWRDYFDMGIVNELMTAMTTLMEQG